MTPRAMRRVFLREAVVTLILAGLAVRVVPASRLFAWAGRAPRRVNRFAAEDVEWIAWAVDRAGRYRFIDALCLPRALAALAMLRRRGIAGRLCLGVARNGSGLAAHAWVEVGGRSVIGGEEAAGFTRLAAYGAK